jgi:hypothetical protein
VSASSQDSYTAPICLKVGQVTNVVIALKLAADVNRDDGFDAIAKWYDDMAAQFEGLLQQDQGNKP